MAAGQRATAPARPRRTRAALAALLLAVLAAAASQAQGCKQDVTPRRVQLRVQQLYPVGGADVSVQLPRNTSACVTRVEQAVYMRGERRVMRRNDTKWDNATLAPGNMISVSGLTAGTYILEVRAVNDDAAQPYGRADRVKLRIKCC